MVSEISLNGGEELFSPGLPSLIMRLHIHAYRKLCDRVEAAALPILQYPAQRLLEYGRRFAVVDYCCALAFRMINCLSNEEHFPKEALKTSLQKQREKEIAVFKERLAAKPAYPALCRAAAELIYGTIPRIFGERLRSLPSQTETYILYEAGLIFRYFNAKLEERSGWREKFLSSPSGTFLKEKCNGLYARFARLVASRENIEPLLDFEHILLNICCHLILRQGGDGAPKHLLKAAIQSLASSIEKQESIDAFLKKRQLGSEEERFIARLQWHKENGSLPKGLPDPEKRRLTTANLEEQLDKALYDHTEALIRQILDKVTSPKLRQGIVGLLYYLEGEGTLISTLAYVAVEYGVKQLADPHRFAVAILQAGGVDTAAYELDGFGREKSEALYPTAKEMLRASLNEEVKKETVITIFKNSGMKPSPLSFEGIAQKEEAKARLREMIASLLYDTIKERDFRYDSFLKRTRERISRLPVIGTATVGLHLLISGAFFSCSYLFRSQKQNDTSYPSWMAQNLAGKSFCDTLADRIIELIYHPSWKVTLLQLVQDLFRALQQQPPRDPYVREKDLRPIVRFLLGHFMKEERIAPAFSSFASENLYLRLKEMMRPSENSLFEENLKSLLPIIKEAALCCRLTNSFREERVCFEGDDKFWELFIRKALDRLVADKIFKSGASAPNLEEQLTVRDHCLDKLLSLEKKALREQLLTAPDNLPILQNWEVVKEEEPAVAIHSQAEIIDDFSRV